MRNFKDFIKKDIVVETKDGAEMRKFLELCEKHDLKWICGGEKATDFKPLSKYIIYGYSKDGLSVSSEPKMLDRKMEIVPAAEFLTKAPTIEIFQSKQTVVCLKKQDNKVVAVGKAKCNPEDQFNFDYGAKLAYERMEMDIVHRTIKMAAESLAQGLSDGINGIKTLKNGMRIKKQDSYEVGDRVLMKKKQRALKVTLHTGEIGVITKIGYSNCYKISFDEKERAQYYSVERIKGKVIQ